MDNNLLMAIAMAFIYWISRGMIGGYFALFFIGNPIFVGIIAGLIYGDITKGLMIGGSISAVFAGIIATGGNMPTDQGMAATTMIPIALSTGLSVQQAVAFAVPLGLVGAQLMNLRKIINIPLVHKAEQYADDLNIKGIERTATLFPAVTSFLILFIPVFIVVLFGRGVVLSALEFIPEWIMHGLEVAGGVLPAVGFALIMNAIGKTRLIPFTLIGFILVSVLQLNNLVTGILAICIAIIIIMNRRQITKALEE